MRLKGLQPFPKPLKIFPMQENAVISPAGNQPGKWSREGGIRSLDRHMGGEKWMDLTGSRIDRTL